MLLTGTLLMGFWLFLVGGLQARFGDWGELNGNSKFLNFLDVCCELWRECSERGLGYNRQFCRYKSRHCLFIPLRVQFCYNDGTGVVDVPS